MFWEAPIFWEALSAAGAVGAAFGVLYGFIQTRRTLKEVKYEKYVERYQEIYTKLPYGILSREDHSADLSDQVRTWLMAYIDLCAEELFDRQRGKIDDVVWNDWAALIRDGLNCPRPHAVLEEHKADYKYLYGFVKTEEVPKLDGVRRQSESEMK